ncbi:MAG: molecular chaperone HtpG [Blastocatellia bacterium]|nr:molecular chaperone HtpG [Blastocatellia bacterium]MBN8726052.1 molecular chaperone HtpG [Acidobacteriota bacterium]
MVASAETFQFQAETKQLLDLVINSLYTHKEIFLRELISNASDAIDKLRFEALTKPELLEDGSQFEIRLESDKQNRTLTISDNGIGMSRDEVIANIGTIARSGTKEFREKLKNASSDNGLAELIGQFGVGFYSAFMAADKVTLVTRRAGEKEATLWESVGDGQYTLTTAERSKRGTSITLHLKAVDSEAGIEDYTDTWTLSNIVKRYSDFVAYPIVTREEREEVERDEDGNPKKDGKKETVIEDKTLNSMKPIWTRPQSEVTESEYAEFYKHISHDWQEPLKNISLRAEGRIEYQALLFIPSKAPFDLYYHGSEWGLRLYAKRILIMEKCEELIPRYLRFIKGIVDSADLPLNISRQTLQQDRHITQIRKWLAKKVLDTLKEMQEKDEEKYLQIWKEFGSSIKEGISSDFENKDKVVSLVLFESSNDKDKLTSLKDYVSRMKEDQKEIFYLTGESRTVVENSPHLEAFREKGYEVLYLVDTVDELVADSLHEFEGKALKSIGKGTIELGSEEEKQKAKQEIEEKQKQSANLLEFIQKKLGEDIKEVRLSNRLTSSPVCLVGAEQDYSPQLERLLRQAKNMPKQKRIMELNPKHDIFNKMQERYEKDKEDPLLGDYSELLLGYALLAEGSELPNPSRFNQLVVSLMTKNL